MKKTITVLLAVLMLAGCFQICTFAATEGVKFAVTTDIHSRDEKELYVNFPENPLYFHARNTGNLYQESYGILRSFLAEAASEKLDFVLIAGDTADGGEKSQHLEVTDILTEFEQDTGIQVYVVPGNHDYKSDTTPDDFKEWYKEFGYAGALTVDEKTASYTADLPGNIRLIAVDSNKPGSDGDGVDDRLFSWIKQEAEKADADGKTVVYMMHHPLLPPIPGLELLMKDFIIRDFNSVAENFTKWGIKYVFTGHEHGNNISCYTGRNGEKVYDILTTALTAYPLEFRTVTLTDDYLAVTTNPIISCNGDYLVNGYTDEQLDLMESDYTAYSLGYFKYSIQKKIGRFTDPEFIKDKLNAETGPLASAVEIVMNNVNKALEMPMYKKDSDGESVEAIANRAGVKLPATGYKSLFDLATTVVANIYRGNENMPTETSPEGKLLMTALNTMLKYVLAESGNDAVRLFLNAAFRNDDLSAAAEIFRLRPLYAPFADIIYSVDLAKLSPVLDKILVDDELPDRDCVIRIGAAASENGFSSFMLKFISFFNYITRIIKAFFLATAY